MDSELFRYLADAQLGDPALTDELLPRPASSARSSSPADLDDVARVRCDRPLVAAAAARGRPSTPTAVAGLVRCRRPRRRGAAARGSRRRRRRARVRPRHRLQLWVVRPELSLSGGALLANDPHLGISMPSIWFINGLHCATVGRRLPVRRGRRQLPGRARCRARPQRPDRVGRDERRSGRPGPRHRDRRSGRPDPLPRRRTALAPVHDADREDPASMAARPSRSRSARRSTVRSSTTSTIAWWTRR